MGQGERVPERRARGPGGRPSARPEPRPARAPSLGRPSSRPAPAAASSDLAGRVSGRPGAGGASRRWKRVSSAFFSTPCARSCRFQEEELRGTSRGSRAVSGARLSSISLPALPRVPWLLWSLERIQRTWGGGGEGCPGPRATGRLSSYWPSPALLPRLDRRGLGKGRHALQSFSPALGHFGNILTS